MLIMLSGVMTPMAWSQTQSSLEDRLKADIELHSHHEQSFELLTQSWTKTYGAQAFQPLLKIAKDKTLLDTERYIAMMSAAKLGGEAAIPTLIPLLHDHSWMIRGGALRALTVIGNSAAGASILPLAHDPALVVRIEAIDALRTLRPQGSVQTLVGMLEDKLNYHDGKAQWVPQRALLALSSMHATDAVPRLKPLLGNAAFRQDPELKVQVERTIHDLTDH
jgi:HEAT repeat protein